MEMKGLSSVFHLEREGGRRERKREEREREEREGEGNYMEPGEKTGKTLKNTTPPPDPNHSLLTQNHSTS